MKTYKIIFPLCLLNYPKEKLYKYNSIISYSIIRFATELMKKTFPSPSEESVDNFISENGIMNFSKNVSLDNHIIYACMITGLVIKDVYESIEEYCEIKAFLDDYENKYGDDALVKIGSELLYEVRDGKFPDRLFRCYCAIKSILGKKDFCRITNRTIAYRMKGFKKLEIMNKEIVNIDESISDRQVSTLTKKLKKMRFIERGTYKRRCTYYSTKYRDDRFNEKLSDYLSSKKIRQECQSIQNEILDKKTAIKFERKAKEMKVNQTVNCNIYNIDKDDFDNSKEFKYGGR